MISRSLTQLLLETLIPTEYNILWGWQKNIHYFVDFSLDKPVGGSKMPLHNSGKSGVPYRVVLTGTYSPPPVANACENEGNPIFQKSCFPICLN
jgi:hypothetical protein